MPFTLNGTTLPAPQEYENSLVKPYLRGDTQGGIRQHTHLSVTYRAIHLKFTALSRAQRESIYTAVLAAMENTVIFQDHRGLSWTVIVPDNSTADTGKEQGYSDGVGPVLYEADVNLLGW